MSIAKLWGHYVNFTSAALLAHILPYTGRKVEKNHLNRKESFISLGIFYHYAL